MPPSYLPFEPRQQARFLLPRRLLAGLALVAAFSLEAAALQDAPVLVGPVTRADLRKAPFSEWFDGQYSRYEPAAGAADRLRAALKNVSVEVYFGTWCGDSRRQVPRLMRLLDLAGLDESKVSLTALSDRPMEFKRAPGRPEAKRYVHRTPTIVILRDGTEAGRIVETPATTLEADLLAVLLGHTPEPRYGAEAFVHRLFLDLSPEAAEKALSTADSEVSRRGDPDSLWHYAEQDLMKNGRPREAVALLDLHLRLNPKSIPGHVVRAEALLALGRKPEAIEAVDRALALDPKNNRALRLVERLRGSP